MTNMHLAQKVIEELAKSGVEEFCLCAGARNSPFIHIFDENKHLKAFHFFEERSAGFFALGRIALTRKPIAIFTTSGTAAAEVLPAAVEGTYSSLPLIIVTADRPKTYRGTGAPQTIDQVGIYSYYIEACFDLDEENTHFSLNCLSWRKPVHVNVCFKEPLLDGEIPKISSKIAVERTYFPQAMPVNEAQSIEDFIETTKPLVIVSTLPEKLKTPVLSFLKKLKAPTYLEGISGLRGHEELRPFAIQSGEKTINYLLDTKICNSILRIGGVPTVRLWRDLEDKRKDIPVLSLGYNHYSGLSREVPHFSDLEILPQIEIKKSFQTTENWSQIDANQKNKLEETLNEYSLSEPGYVRKISSWIKASRQPSVYLGNSLPVREWDFFALTDFTPQRVVANRGANGIDGQISTFLGWAKSDSTCWCIVGDLTTLYDLSALWISNQLNHKNMRIVIINNGGGQIFNRMFDRKVFINEHQIQFDHWAKMWGWSYHKIVDKQVNDFNPSMLSENENYIIEVTPNPEETKLFWQKWGQIRTSDF